MTAAMVAGALAGAVGGSLVSVLPVDLLHFDPSDPCAEPAWLAHYVWAGQQLLAFATGHTWSGRQLAQARAVAAAVLPVERPEWVCAFDDAEELRDLLGLSSPIAGAPVPDPTPGQVRSAVWALLGEVAYDLGVRFGDLPGQYADGEPDRLALAQLAALAATAHAGLVEAQVTAERDAADQVCEIATVSGGAW